MPARHVSPGSLGDTGSLAKYEGNGSANSSPSPGVYTLTGHVYYANGTPAANATVSWDGSQTGSVTSDASGLFKVILPAINCFDGSHAVEFRATLPDPSCPPSNVRRDSCPFFLCSFFIGCGDGGDFFAGDIHLGLCESPVPPSPTPPPADDRSVKPIPYPSPVPTDSSFYGTVPGDALTQTVPRSGVPITRPVEITRVVGEVKPEDGTLTYASELVNNGVVSRYATLKIPAYDVDSSGGELDHVLFNGVEIGPGGSKAYLTGKDKAWFISEFQVPIELVRFGKKSPTAGQPPAAGVNEIKIVVDESNNPARWRVAVGAPKIEFEALYLVVMVHGNGSCGGFFAGDWLCGGTPVAPDRWFTRPFIDQKIPFDNSIALPIAPIVDNASRLLAGSRSIFTIAEEWGAKHVHIVAHSKGGLDVRGFLTGLPAEDEPAGFGVLSFTTLATPHLGSVGADYQDTVAQLNRMNQLEVNSVAQSDSPFRVILASRLGTDPAKHDLRVDTMRRFNEWNIKALPSTFKVDGKTNSIEYFAIAPDANLDESVGPGSVIEQGHPERYLPTITDGSPNPITFEASTFETEGVVNVPVPLLEGLLYTQVYRLLGSVDEAVIGRGWVPGLGFPRPIPIVSEIPQPCWFKYNDFAVTRASALSDVNPCNDLIPAPDPLVPFKDQRPIMANHATLSNATTALFVINWIKSTQPMPQ